MVRIVSIVVEVIFIPVWVGLIQIGIRQQNYHSCTERQGRTNTCSRSAPSSSTDHRCRRRGMNSSVNNTTTKGTNCVIDISA
jgi:hypothetical protein